MKKNFPTHWANNQAGFIALPILALILLGTAIVGGGGYTVYKVNQIEQKNAEVIADLQAKLEQVATTTQETVVETATSTEMVTTTEDIATSTDISTEPEPQVKPAQVYIPTPVTAPVVATPTVVDVCSNIVGVQSIIPDGYKLSGTTCVQREDKCFNIEGVQGDVPSGMLVFKGYGCMTEREMEKIEEVERDANSAAREAEQLAEECSALKESVYEMDQEMLDIEKKYLTIIENNSPTGIARQFAEDWEQSQKNQMYSEIQVIEIDRNKLANEYNFKCL